LISFSSESEKKWLNVEGENEYLPIDDSKLDLGKKKSLQMQRKASLPKSHTFTVLFVK